MGSHEVIVLDTHVIVWTQEASVRIGKRTKSLIDRHWESGSVYVSAVSFWEIGQLVRCGRLNIPGSLRSWRATLLNSGLIELPISGEIAIRSLELESLHHDPADRFIAVTALAQQATLVTADEKLLDWDHPLVRQDART